MNLGLSVFDASGKFTYVSHTIPGAGKAEDWEDRSVAYGIPEESWLWSAWGKALTRNAPVDGTVEFELPSTGKTYWSCRLFPLPENPRHRMAVVWREPWVSAIPSEDELACLRLLGDGHRLSEAPKVLNISTSSAKSLLKGVRGKLKARTNTHAVKIATKNGWL